MLDLNVAHYNEVFYSLSLVEKNSTPVRLFFVTMLKQNM